MPVGDIWKFDIEQCEVNMILGSNGIVQKLEMDMSCSSFSRQLKVSENRNQSNRITIAVSGQFKQRDIAIRNF